jgi:putative transposase
LSAIRASLFARISIVSSATDSLNLPLIFWCWPTDREPLLDSPELRQKVWEHIKENAKAKEIFIDIINGYQEHCHSLISLGIDQTISKTMQLLKGESSYWINKQHLCKQKFE